MATPLEFADALWKGAEQHPFGATGSVQIDPKTLFVASFGNSVAMVTKEGLLVVDTGSPLTAPAIADEIGSFAREPVEVVIYTHGHIDHVMGAALLAGSHAQVIAHENVASRFDRYRLTAGYNAEINRRQFGLEDLEWPTDYRYPDRIYSDVLVFDVGGEAFELRHGKGETDDATWVWAPDRDLICCGDFFIWACPNAGNPQKAQRYPREWAIALREMAELEVSNLLPGHGPPVVGAERVAAVLNDSAALLEDLVSQTLELMNEGASLDEVLARIKMPKALLEKPYLRPVYDEPEFIVRNAWRLYGGWFDGDPAHLKPASGSTLASEIAKLSGGAGALAARAELLFDTDPRTACELAELALAAAPDDAAVRDVNARIYDRRAELESSTMSKGIYTWAARRSRGGP